MYSWDLIRMHVYRVNDLPELLPHARKKRRNSNFLYLLSLLCFNLRESRSRITRRFSKSEYICKKDVNAIFAVVSSLSTRIRAASEYWRNLSPVALLIVFSMIVIGSFTYNCNNVVPERVLNYLFIISHPTGKLLIWISGQDKLMSG